MMKNLPKIAGVLQEKVVAPGKDFVNASKEPLKRFVKQPADRTRLINEEGTEVDGNLVQSAGIDNPYLNSNLYSHDSPSPASRLHTKALGYIEACPCCCRKKRWQIAILAHVGFLIGFGIRCNLGAARVRMTQNYTNPTTNMIEFPPFDWSYSTMGVLEGAFFYGYLITQVPGGYLATKFPANKMFGIAIGSVSFLNLFMPVACNAGYGLVIMIQIMQGLVQGVAYPACHGIWRHWAPPLERSKIATTALTGSYAGAVIGMPLSSMLTAYCGWQSSFYVYGVAGCIWFFVWWGLSFEKPACHPTISDDEKVYIETAIGETSHVIPKLSNIPWKAIFTSKPVYAIIVANVCRSWTFYLLLNHQLTFFKQVLHYDIQEGGWLASIPHVVMAIVVLLGGQLADYLRSNKILSTTSVRKIFNCGGFGLEALFLIVTGFTRNSTGALFALILAVGFSGFAISGYNVNHLDIAPRYASILMGISNGIGCFSGILCPAVTERLTKEYGVKGWETVFLIAGLVHFTGITFFAIFASGEKQPWAEPPSEEETWKPSKDLPKTGEMAKLSYGATGAKDGGPSNPYTTEPQPVQGYSNGRQVPVYDPNLAWGDDSQSQQQPYDSYGNNYESYNDSSYNYPPTSLQNPNYHY